MWVIQVFPDTVKWRMPNIHRKSGHGKDLCIGWSYGAQHGHILMPGVSKSVAMRKFSSRRQLHRHCRILATSMQLANGFTKVVSNGTEWQTTLQQPCVHPASKTSIPGIANCKARSTREFNIGLLAGMRGQLWYAMRNSRRASFLSPLVSS